MEEKWAQIRVTFRNANRHYYQGLGRKDNQKVQSI
jgi:hypothetical protein